MTTRNTSVDSNKLKEIFQSMNILCTPFRVSDFPRSVDPAGKLFKNKHGSETINYKQVVELETAFDAIKSDVGNIVLPKINKETATTLLNAIEPIAKLIPARQLAIYEHDQKPETIIQTPFLKNVTDSNVFLHNDASLKPLEAFDKQEKSRRNRILYRNSLLELRSLFAQACELVERPYELKETPNYKEAIGMQTKAPNYTATATHADIIASGTVTQDKPQTRVVIRNNDNALNTAILS